MSKKSSEDEFSRDKRPYTEETKDMRIPDIESIDDTDFLSKASVPIIDNWPLISRLKFVECLVCYAVDEELGNTVSFTSSNMIMWR